MEFPIDSYISALEKTATSPVYPATVAQKAECQRAKFAIKWMAEGRAKDCEHLQAVVGGLAGEIRAAFAEAKFVGDAKTLPRDDIFLRKVEIRLNKELGGDYFVFLEKNKFGEVSWKVTF